MLNVFLTVDVEVWCGGWRDIDRKFADAFRRYVYGRTPKGDYGLPYQIETLNARGLTASFFVEPLFATRFGLEPLAEIVGLIRDGGQDVQLHLHPEWIDESKQRILENATGKRARLSDYTLREQKVLIAEGRRLLAEAGGGEALAFRSGNFSFNADTLRALSANGLRFDTSYNASYGGMDSGVMPGVAAVSPFEFEGVYEYPVTVYRDGTGALRHAQLAACSHAETAGLLWRALDAGHETFVYLFHNFELLGATLGRADGVAVGRFLKLCTFLDRHRRRFVTTTFRNAKPKVTPRQPEPLASPLRRAAARMLAQAYRRRYR